MQPEREHKQYGSDASEHFMSKPVDETQLEKTELVESLESRLVSSEHTDMARKTLQLGTRFSLNSEIGHGAWSTVYSAWDNHLEKAVAVKVLHSHLIDKAERLQRFQLEAETVGR